MSLPMPAPIHAAVADFKTGVILAVTDSDLSDLNIAPQFDALPFMPLVTKMIGGLWALAFALMVGCWILASLVWVISRVVHSGMMQQYSGTVFVWAGIGTVLLGSALTLTKYLATQPMVG